MATALKAPPVSMQAYLEHERTAAFKSEYYNGEVIPMPGASRIHNLLVGTLIGLLFTRLTNPDCEFYPSDMRVRVDGTYVYPDVVVVCGGPEMEDGPFYTLLNPTVLIEVLSPSTEDYDRGRKSLLYRALPSLQDYLLVEQSRMHVEHYTRHDEGWLLRGYSAPDDTIALPSIDCTLPLSEIYQKVLPLNGNETGFSNDADQ